MLRSDHMVLPVSDPVASLAFYSEVLGLPLIGASEGDDWGGKPWLMMAFALADCRELVLVALRGVRPKPDPNLPADARHYAFSVETNAELGDWRQRLAAAAVESWDEDHGDQQSIYLKDPDGTVLEITSPPSNPSPSSSPHARAKIARWVERNGSTLTP